MKATTQETPTDAQATVALKTSLFAFFPKSQLMIAPNSGAKIIRLRKLFSILTLRFPSVFQNAGIVNINGNAVSEKGDYYSQTYRRFCCGNAHDHKDKKLPGCIVVKPRKSYERNVNGIKHQLDAHEHADSIAFEDDANCAYCEQNP